MDYDTYVTLRVPVLSEQQFWALADALADAEIPGHVMDSTVAGGSAPGLVEIEYYVRAESAQEASGLALIAIFRACHNVGVTPVVEAVQGRSQSLAVAV